MLDQSKLKIGQKVYYQPLHYGSKYENGMIKSIPNHTTESVFVVYNCCGDWKNFKNYTGALTKLTDLKLGWNHEN